MRLVEKTFRPIRTFCAALAVASLIVPGHTSAQTTAPYLLPYTINTYAGGGTAPKTGDACQGQSVSGTAGDANGDGCLVTSSSISLPTGDYGYDIRVDGQGNVYFADASSTTKGIVRVIEARSKLMHVFTGNSKACGGASTSYGDGCPANDGIANTSPNYTPSFGVTGLDVAKNGDVYIGSGSNNVVHKVSAATGVLSVVAGFISGGVGSGGYTGDGGLATNAEIGTASGVGLDSAGNLYIADSADNVIRKVTAVTGIITTIAGVNPNTGGGAAAGYTGDGGPATQATLSAPVDIKIDANGNIFIADAGNLAVRVIYEGGAQVANLIALNNLTITAAQVVVGNIYTILGGSPLGSTTLGSASTSPKLGTGYKLGSLRKIALDIYGNIYAADSASEVINFEDGATGWERIFVGIRKEPTTSTASGCATGASALLGDGCPATQATLNPTGHPAFNIATDPFGNIYIYDFTNGRVRKVSTNQIFPATAAGSSVQQTLMVHFAPNDTPAASSPYTISTNPSGGSDFTLTSSTCTVNSTFDHTDDCLLLITYTPSTPGNSAATLTIKSTAGQTSTFPLTGTGIAPSIALDPGTTAIVSSSLHTPTGIAQDGAGNTYVADTANNRIVRFNTAGTPTTIAGTGASGYTGDNAAAALATLASPKGVAVTANGTVYIADTGNNAVRRIDPLTGVITTVAGSSSSNTCTSALDSYNNGCLGTQASLSAPAGIAVDGLGNVYIADTGNSIVRELVPSGYIFLAAGGASSSCGPDPFGNGCPGAQAILNGPTGLSIDSQNNLYIADTGNHEIRELVAASNTVTDIAGDGQGGAAGNTGLATSAQLNTPTGVAVDAAGDVYIADTGNHAIRFVNASGVINTVAGLLSVSGTGTAPGSASNVLLNLPTGIASHGDGKLYALDSGNNRLLSITRTSSNYDFGHIQPGSSSPVLRLQETSTGSDAATLSNPLFATSGNYTFFSVTASGSNGCTPGQNLTAGTTCYLSAQFNPTGLGPENASFVATATDTNTPAISAPAITLQLSGTGVVLTHTTSATALTSPVGTDPTYGTAFIVTTTITPTACNTAAPNCALTGTVTFYVDNVQVGLPVAVTSTTGASATATASTSITGPSHGSHTVAAVYNGDGNYQSSTAPDLTVNVAAGITTTAVTPSPATLQQFQPLTLTATVSSNVTASSPSGNVNFYAGSTLLGTVGLVKGVAVLQDTTPATTLGLYAGTYNITAAYTGDQNFSGSTSAGSTVTVTPDPAATSLQLFTPLGNTNVNIGNLTICPTNTPGSGITLTNSAAIGTSEGSTAATCVYVTPTNTVNDTLTFSCSNLPQYSVCTFSPTNLIVTPVPGAPSSLNSQVTLWTDVIPGVIPQTAQNERHTHTTLATLFGWPLLLLSLAAMTMRKRMAGARLFSILALCALLASSSLVMSGCGSNDRKTIYLTPTGTYNVTVTVSGAHTPAQSVPIVFTVAPGLPGQE